MPLKVTPKVVIVFIESTIRLESIDRYVRLYTENQGKQIGFDIHLVHVPERIISGNMVCKLFRNDRIIGADDPAIGEKAEEFYVSF